MSYYDVLEVEPTASRDDIERAFKRLAREVHPDLTGGDRAKAEERMKQLNEIRDTLTDPLLRAGYDERLRLERQRAEAAAAAQQPGAPTAPAQRLREQVGARRIGSSNPTLIGVLVLGTSLSTGLLWYFRHYLPAQATARAAQAAPQPAPAVPELAPPPPPRPAKPARPRPRNYVRLGARLDEVLGGLGAPDRVVPGKRQGDATLYYGALKLEITNGRLSSGEPPH
jgi:curved DNA-binding protein CbpA